MDENLEDFLWKVYEGEGLGYSLTDYFGSDISENVNDEELIQLWQEASLAIKKLKNYMDPLWNKLNME